MPAKKGKIVVAMSGGVDSSVAACLLVEQGYDVVGLFMRVGAHSAEDDTAEDNAAEPDRHKGCCSAADAADARLVAGNLGISFYALNFKEDFDRIIDYFADEYIRGRTPNPCVVCNDRLKFGKLFRYADSIGAERVATGHYARIIHDSDASPRLARSADPAKDQTYVLFGINRNLLRRIVFPLGDMTKDRVREEARRFGLSLHDKPDSADICFVPDRDYARVVRQRHPDGFEPGSVVDTDGNEVGEHNGIANFTVGQRRGLGIAMGLPIYVTNLDPRTATVTVGEKHELLDDTLLAANVNWLVDPLDRPLRVEAKIRYAHQAAPATVTPRDDARVEVVFDEPQTAIAPGQAVVWYKDGVVLGGGWIERALKRESL